MNLNVKILLQAAEYRPMSLQAPSAWVGHLPFAWWLIQTQRPQTLVELGTHSGNSYFTFCQAVQDGACKTDCYAVDTWQGDEHAGEYGEDIYQQVDEFNAKHFAAFSSLLRMTFDQALEVIPDGTVDLLHIDGLHTYESVRHDFETWLPKLSPDALVLFHDTRVHERGFGVWQYWEEIRTKYPHGFEFEHSNGLGVLQVGDGQACPVMQLMQGEYFDRLQAYFSALGTAQLDRFNRIEAVHRLQAEKDNARAQIQFRDELVEELRKLLQSEKDNARAQIQFRDELVEELRKLLQSEKDNAQVQIQFKDELIEQLRKKVQDEKDITHAQTFHQDSLMQFEKEHASIQIAIREQQLQKAYTLKGLMRHMWRKFLGQGAKG